ncbi:unnamed protein product [Prorocentrum cordatum]|uniref:Uncharacterized protein n=1 Tax=Prorocentrum cordatum TaxID=2364126 RepID=A0ABN9PIL0_9DINO|nr:unnamed protein product [Polarella glacialis]
MKGYSLNMKTVNRAINDGKRGVDYMQKFPKGIDLSRATVLIECDSGRANGNPESDEIARYKSIGGHFLFIVDHDVLSGKLVTAALMDYSSKSTQRVCRSTLAAEASHLADSLEAGEWLCVLLEEVFNPKINLKDWQKIVLLNPIELRLIDYDVNVRPLEFERKTCRMTEMVSRPLELVVLGA